MVLSRRRAAVVAAVALAVTACSAAPQDTVPVESSSVTASSGTPDAPTASGSTGPAPTPTVTEQPSAAGPDPDIDEGPSDDDGRRRLVADLDSGALTPGDEGARGRFQGVLTPREATVELCYELFVENLSSNATGADLLHVDRDGQATRVAELAAPAGGSVEDCVIIDGGDAVGLFQSPSEHEVLVMTDDHPRGAISGVLSQN